MFAALLLATVAISEPGDKQAELLRTFREEFVHITPGKGKFPVEFQMGRDEGAAAERPARTVRMDRDFHIANYEVPQNLWEAVMGSNPSRWKGARNSVEMLTHNDALEFCKRATELMRNAKLIAHDEVIRLPTEAEWEYAARAGTTTTYSFGNDAEKLGDYGWFHGNAAGNDPAVGAKKPNPWGLYDVPGYLWEWCADHWYDSHKDAPTDAAARSKKDDGGKTTFVVRGGSWKDPAEHLTSTYRMPARSSTRDDALGLRCVLSKE